MKKNDNSMVVISSFKYSNYKIKLSSTPYGQYLNCIGTNLLSSSDITEATKWEVLYDMLELGSKISQKVILKNKNKPLKVSKHNLSFINEDDKRGTYLLKDFIEDGEPENFFEDLSAKVIDNKDLKKAIERFVKKYGMYIVEEGMYYLFDREKADKERILWDKKITEKTTFKDLDNSNNLIDIVSSNSNSFYISKSDKNKIKQFRQKSNCNLVPLLNISTMMYYIYSIQNSIIDDDQKTLSSCLLPFDNLSIYYNRHKYDNNTHDLKKYILLYVRLLLKILYRYIEISIPFEDEYGFLENDNNTKYYYDSVYLTSEYYLMRTPIYVAINFLRQIMTQNCSFKFYNCNNCGEILNYKSTLCLACKIKIGNELVNDNKTKSDIKESIKKELKDIKNNGIEADTQNICKIFNNRLYRNRNYYKKSKNK